MRPRIDWPAFHWEQLDRSNSMRKIFTLALVASALIVSACNTVEGAGKDVQSAGETVEDAAK
ncbi:hypothetical protein ACFB49_44700 [Sphingomonas sp. DBB INV C78]